MVRKEQNKFWLLQTIEENLKASFYNHPEVKLELERQLNLIDTNKTTPFEAADALLKLNN